MLFVVMLSVITALVLVLLSRFIGLDRGVDDDRETVNGVVVGTAPYVTPEIDKELTDQLKSLQQMYVPVQYVDNGLLHTIKSGLDKQEVQKALKPPKYEGPSAYVLDDYSAKVKNAKFTDEIQNFESNVFPKFSDGHEIEPYNSLSGMIVSDGQTTASL